MKFRIVIVSILFTLHACKHKVSNCLYTKDKLTKTGSFKFVQTIVDDTIIEVKEIPKNSKGYGTYVFDVKEQLRFYGFYSSDRTYIYSESYDTEGNITEIELVPIIEYTIFKEKEDSIRVEIQLFALNKNYEEIKISSSSGQNFDIMKLYPSEKFSNSKCFPIKLRKVNNPDLSLRITGVFSEECNGIKHRFEDSINIKPEYYK